MGWSSSYHIRGAEGLAYMLANPTDTAFVSPSEWDVALAANKYDALLLEPYITDTPSNEASAFQSLVAAAASKSPAPQLFIYETWPQTTTFGAAYQTYWAATPSGTNFTQQRASYDAFYTTISGVYGSSRVRVIPAGSVMNAVDVAARAGLITGVTKVDDLYRDATHMGDVGQWIAACTVFSTIYKRRAVASARTLKLYTSGSGSVLLTLPMAQQLAGIVWDTVSGDSRASH